MVPVLRLSLRFALALPDALARPLCGPPPTNDRGVTLDGGAWRMHWLNERIYGHIAKGAPASARAGMRRSLAIVASRPAHALVVRDDRARGVPVRIYQPPTPRAVLVYLHGGGWVQGDLDTHDALCRRLAGEADRLVISVDYRLAPEHPFPAGLHDVLDAFAWARELASSHGLSRVELGGDSAGGNLTAAACLVLRDRGEELPALQLLLYPGLDQTRALPSHRTFAAGPILTAADIDWFQAHYRPDFRDPTASPLLAPTLAGLPPAIVATAGFDPLRDEGEAFAARLREAGVPTVHLDEADLVHGYAQMDGVLASCDAALGRIVEAVRAVG